MIKLNRIYIKKLLAAYGRNQSGLANRAGMDSAQLSKVLRRNNGRCTLATGKRIADALMVDLEEICESWE